MQKIDQSKKLTTLRRKRILKVKWMESETNKLLNLVHSVGEDWRLVGEGLQSKSAKQCMQKFQNLIKVRRKGNWRKEEDDLLREWVKENGPRKWTKCAQTISGRGGKQCRERWLNSLDPTVKKGSWNVDEQQRLFDFVKAHWSSWAIICKCMPGRTENSVKNYFYSSVRKFKTTLFFRFLADFITYGKNLPFPVFLAW